MSSKKATSLTGLWNRNVWWQWPIFRDWVKWENRYPVSRRLTTLHLGRSIPGFHAGEISQIVQVLRRRSDVKADQITAVAYSDLGPALLHAAA